MTVVAHWLTEAGLARPSFLPLFVAKTTALLAVAWLLYFAAHRVNPRWRVLVWRSSAAGILILAVLAVIPPLFELPMLSSDSTVVDGSVASQRQGSVDGDFGQKRPSAADSAVVTVISDNTDIAGVIEPRLDGRRNVQNSVRRANGKTSESASRNWPGWIAAIYLSGVLVGLSRVAFGARRMSSIRRQSHDVSERIKTELVRAAAHLGLPLTMQVCESQAVQTPCLVGMWRPMILLPVTQSKPEFAAELPAILAHELAHVRGGDLYWNNLLASLSILLWFHPMAWRIRLAHADACDEVADAIAADYVGDARHYGGMLARLALRVQHRAAVGLAMARPSGVRRRVESIQRHVFRYGLPRRQVASAVMIAICVCVLLGGMVLTYSVAESPPQPSSTAKPDTSGMIIRAVAEKTGESLEGVELRLHGRIGGDRVDRYLTTDREGKAQFEWKGGGPVEHLWMTAKKSALVPIHYVWRSDRNEVQLPETLELKFQPGNRIGGVARDEAGEPIAGASVELHMPVTWPKLQSYVFTMAELTTDESGRWEFDGAPPDAGSIGITVQHPNYLLVRTRATLGADNAAVLKQGLSIVGNVLDRNLQPVVAAKAALGVDRFGSDDPDAKTDAQGRFVLKNCKPGKTLVTVTAAGFTPQIKELVVGQQNKELLFTLDPGHTMKARVVDVEGNPVEGAFFAADTWRGNRSLEFRVDTPADGRITWDGAPPDTVLYDIGKAGYMSSRHVAIKPEGEEHVVTLHPVLEISGRVTDARTGEAIKDFTVTHGYQFATSTKTYWDRDQGIAARDGKYSYKFDEPMKGYFLKVAAPGYLPATSRMFLTTEGKVTFDFELESGEGPSGVVLLPDGGPVGEAQVGLATREQHAMLDMGRFDRNQNSAEVVETNAEGRFSFLPQTETDFLLIVLHEAGFAEVWSEEFAKSQEIRLQPWGRIEGRAVIGRNPDVNREISFQPKRTSADGKNSFNYVFSYGYDTRTDQDGHFVMDRVIPSSGSLARVVITEFLRSQQHAPGWHQQVEVRPDETLNVTVGGTGRPVTGRVVLDREPDVDIDWTTNEPAALVAWDKVKGTRAETFQRYLGNFDKSGQFEIPDVPEGDYQLEISVNNPPVPNACGAGDAIGKAELTVTVPKMADGRSDEPLDLGEVTAKLFDTLDVGELVPDFVAQRLDGGSARMSDFRGKVVLLDFWATWCAPCVAEMPTLREIHQTHSSNPRFVLLSVSCDDDSTAAKKFVIEHRLPWQHLNVHGTQAGVPKDYTVRTLPASFLVGPNGRVIGKNLRGEELKDAVTTALGNEDLFRGDFSERPARFPIVRFDVTEATPAEVEPGSVVVADDTDPNFEKDRPHTDGVRLLTPSGEERWSAGGLNNCQTVGGIHGVAVDPKRGRVYARELVAHRILAYTADGKKLWQIEGVDADALAVDEQTGNLWASGGSSLNDGQTIVFDPQGNEVAAYPFRGIDIAHDPQSGSFWLAGYELIKVDRSGEVLFRKPVAGWCYASASVNPTDGSVWIVERDHPDVSGSKNRLWLLARNGDVRQEVDLGKDGAFVIECDPKSGDAWFSGYGRGLRRVTASGELGEPLAITASNIAISPTTGDVWMATADAVLRLDGAGKVLNKVPHRAESRQAWLAAF
jgi:beta-lactamase regulating signal transducer with metallopeptidase domain/thiol-disulfide isomerase/thioredoxin